MPLFFAFAGSYLVTAHAQYESANASMPANQQPQASCSGGQQTYSLALYDDPHSLFCAKVKIAMVAKSIKWTSLSVPCGSTRSEEYRARVPLGKIPALVATLESGAEVSLRVAKLSSQCSSGQSTMYAVARSILHAAGAFGVFSCACTCKQQGHGPCNFTRAALLTFARYA